MKNLYSLALLVIILASCQKEKEISLDAILATNNIEQIKSKKAEIDAKKQ
jgi:hypothetical protein